VPNRGAELTANRDGIRMQRPYKTRRANIASQEAIGVRGNAMLPLNKVSPATCHDPNRRQTQADL